MSYQSGRDEVAGQAALKNLGMFLDSPNGPLDASAHDHLRVLGCFALTFGWAFSRATVEKFEFGLADLGP